jgi:hypothetical protein
VAILSKLLRRFGCIQGKTSQLAAAQFTARRSGRLAMRKLSQPTASPIPKLYLSTTFPFFTDTLKVSEGSET